MNSSATTKHSSQPDLSLGSVQCRRWFMLSAGGILLFSGITRLIEVFGNVQQLDISAPIVLISFRQLLGYVGIVELIVACLCLFANKRTLSLLLITWLVTICGVYRAGLWTIGWYHPYPISVNLMQTFNISPFIADGVATTTSTFLFIGSLGMLWIENGKTHAAASPTKERLK